MGDIVSKYLDNCTTSPHLSFTGPFGILRHICRLVSDSGRNGKWLSETKPTRRDGVKGHLRVALNLWPARTPLDNQAKDTLEDF